MNTKVQARKRRTTNGESMERRKTRGTEAEEQRVRNRGTGAEEQEQRHVGSCTHLTHASTPAIASKF